MATQVYVNDVTQSDAAEFNRFDTAAYAMLSGVGGTANAITAGGPANYTLSAALPVVWFLAANTNTGATAIVITPSGSAALTSKNIFANGSACTGGEIVSGRLYGLAYDGTQFNLVSPSPIVSTFTGTLTGGDTSPTYTFYYTKVGNQVTVFTNSDITATSNAATKTITGMPAAIRPARTVFIGARCSDNGGAFVSSFATIASDGVITVAVAAAGGNWTASGTATIQLFSCSYTQA